MIINPANLNALFTGYDTRFSQVYASFKTEPWYSKFSMEMPSKTTTNVYAWMAKFPGMREWVGPRVVNNLTTRSYTLTNKKFELTLSLGRDTLEDDQYEVYGPWMDMAAYEAAKWPDTQIAPLLIGGATSTPGTCFDGQNFFDPAHPVDAYDAGKGTQSNYFTGKALTFDNYSSVRASMITLQGENQKTLGIVPNLLIVPPQLEAQAKVIVNSALIAPATLNGVTQVGGQDNPMKGTAEVLMIPELASAPTEWYLMDTRKPVKPLIWQLRTAPEFTYRNQLTDEHVFTADEFLYGVRARGVPGFGLWFLAAKAVA